MMRRPSSGIGKKSAFAAATVLVICAAHSAYAEVVGLESLERGAVERRAQSRADAAAITAARADVAGAKAAYLPQAGFSAEVSGAPGGHLVHVTDSSGTAYLVAGSRALGEQGAFLPEARYEGYLSLTGRLYDFQRTRTSVRAAEAGVSAAEAEQRAARAGILNEVRAAYLDWLGAEMLHAASARALESARSRLELVNGRIETGTRPKSDSESARYDLALAELDECEARRNVANARLTLSHAAASPLPEGATPDPAVLDRTPPGAHGGESPEEIALSRRSASALATARFYEHENAPVLSAGVRAGVRGQMGNVFPDYRAALSLSVPIWDGGASAARAARARAQAAALDAQTRERRTALETERRRAESDWANGNERQRLTEALYASAAARKRDAAERYDLGQGTIEAVVDADSGLARAERELILARIARADAVLRMTDPDVTNGGK